MFTKDMISKLKAIANNPIISGTFIVTVGVFLGSVFSYLLQIGLGHLLSIEDFGTFNAFLSLAVIFSIPSGAIATSLIKKVSELLAKNDFYTLKKLFWNLSKVSLGFGLILSLLFVALNDKVSEYLNVPHNTVVFMFAAFLATSFINVAPISYLQGLLRFKAFAFFSLLSQFIRLLIPLCLVYAGLSVSGAYLGLTLVGGLSFLISVALLNKNFAMGVTPTKNFLDTGINDIYKQLLKFSVPVFFINSGIAILNNVDVVMAKHFFNPFDAGTYSGVVTICKVFLFGASIVQVVMFPQISHLFASNRNYKNRFIKFLTLQLILILGGLAIFALFPSQINTVMFRGKFNTSVPYLPLFSVFIAFYILVTFLSMFLLAINKTKAYLIILPACALQYVLITLSHNDINSIIKANITAGALACLFISIYVGRSILHSPTNKSSGKIDI